MSKEWYEIINSDYSLTQGDIISDCPLVSWKAEEVSLEGKGHEEVLKASTEVISADVIILSQSCDLENQKIRNVILCPHLDIDEYKQAWESTITAKQNRGKGILRTFEMVLFGTEACLIVWKMKNFP
jgi:hypothetical protein